VDSVRSVLLRPGPTGSDPAPRIFGILDVDPGLSGIFVGLSREFLQFFEAALALGYVLFDGKGIPVVLVDLEFLSHLVPEVLLVVRHAVADALQVAAVQGQDRKPVDKFFVGGNLLVVQGQPLRSGSSRAAAGFWFRGVRVSVVVLCAVLFDVNISCRVRPGTAAAAAAAVR